MLVLCQGSLDLNTWHVISLYTFYILVSITKEVLFLTHVKCLLHSAHAPTDWYFTREPTHMGEHWLMSCSPLVNRSVICTGFVSQQTYYWCRNFVSIELMLLAACQTGKTPCLFPLPSCGFNEWVKSDLGKQLNCPLWTLFQQWRGGWSAFDSNTLQGCV